MQYMRAHGNAPGPTQRPMLAGAITGCLAEVPTDLMFWWSGALVSVAESLSIKIWIMVVLHLLTMTIGGAIYGYVFSRAANDRQGGWLFGISYGFLIWMLGPVTILQWILKRPLALGVAAMGVLAAHLIYGLFLGLMFPSVHQVLQRELKHIKEPQGRGIFGAKPEAALIQPQSDK